MIPKWSLVAPGCLWLAVALCSGCSGGMEERWHVPTRVSVVNDELGERFIDGPYCVQYRATKGVPSLGESFALLTAPADGRVILPTASEEFFQKVHQSQGPSLSDFRVDLEYRVEERGVVTGQLKIDRFNPDRAHWSRCMNTKLGEPITMLLETPGQVPVTMQLRVLKVAGGHEREG